MNLLYFRRLFELRFYCGLLFILVSNVYAGNISTLTSAEKFIKELSNRLLQELDAKEGELKNNNKLAYSIAEKIVLPSIDVLGMSRSVLGRKVWNNMNSKQREEFTSNFTKLIMKTYSRSLTGYNKDKIKTYPLRKRYEGKKKVVIKSLLIRSHGQKIKLKYRMILKNNNWKIYDFSVSGVSLLRNFRTQFARELSNGSLEELIDKMKKK
ncbi:MAG: ABC transporter substrate-binding protein [Legionellales bacterium]|nr:ABC transporter substrate-binding protein [Legionellales bacterium]